MRRLALLALLLATPAAAQTVTDNFGRSVTCTGAGPVTCTTSTGISVQNTTVSAALAALNGMAPAGWSQSQPVAAPTPEQQAAALQAGGIAITSTGTPALSGVYALDASTQAAVNAVSTYVLVNPGKFPGGGASMAFLDANGQPHVFTSTTEWQAFATAIANVVAQLALYGAGQGTAPTMAATIP